MEHKVKGTIIEFKEIQEGTSAKGVNWKKQVYILDTKEEYDNILAFEVFGSGEKVANVEKVRKYNKEGDSVTVTFNIRCNEYEGRYFTSLSSWKIEKIEETYEEAMEDSPQGIGMDPDDLPF
jgi:hypothetical protein